MRKQEMWCGKIRPQHNVAIETDKGGCNVRKSEQDLSKGMTGNSTDSQNLTWPEINYI